MSARGLLSVVGSAVGGLIGWSEPAPPAEPAVVRALFADLGVRVGPDEAELAEAVRHFQYRTGLTADGTAGPQTIHLLSRYATEARESTWFEAA